MTIMETMLNFESKQVKCDMPSSRHTPSTSSQGDNGDGDQQSKIATIQNVAEAPPASGKGAQVQDSNQRPVTQHQIKEMESFFKECPYPDEKQRRELGNLLELNSAQIKFWFQNKHTQMRAMLKRHKNTLLIVEYEKLRAENLKYKEELSKAKRLGCGGLPSVGEMSFAQQQLRLENARLKEEIETMVAKNAKKIAGTSFSNLPPPPYTPTPSLSLDNVNYVPQSRMEMQVHGGSNPQRSIITIPFTESEKACIVKLAVAAMEEFTKMAHDGGPLWIPGIHAEILNQQEYVRSFPVGLGPRPLGFRSEASRESMIVIMNPNNLIEILMDVNQWSTVFANIVSRARITEILSTGEAGSYDRALQAMSVEFQVLSHLVPTRDSYFIRYCKHHPDGAWAVVDISLDNMRPGAATSCKRRPSGCMIQELPNGFSKVTWTEHVDVEDREEHDLFKHLVNSGFAFGVRRWIATLDRQCDRLAYTMAANIQPGDLSGITLEGRKSLMNLAEKIMQSYCNYVGASPPPHVWTVQITPPSGFDDVRFMTRNHIDRSGRLIGLVISAETSFSFSVPPKRLFDFLRNENSRNQWDFFTNGDVVQELARIAIGRDPANFVSLLRANSANGSKRSKIIVQETCTDSTGLYMVYSPIEPCTLNLVLSGSNPDYGILLPSGFAIFPDGSGLSGRPIIDDGSRRCLGTVAYQILVEATPTPLPPDIVFDACNLMKCTIEKIRAAMMSVSA